MLVSKVKLGRVFPLVLFNLFANSLAIADPVSCATIFLDVPLRNGLASASTMTNLWGGSDSLAKISRKMIEEATQTLPKAARPQTISCPDYCQEPLTPVILLSTKPNKTLGSYSDKEVCQSLLTKTLEKPLSFEGRKFKNVDSLTGYFTSFAQGQGTDGAELYRECHSSCSPTYKSIIEVKGEALTMSTAVVCGHARDKSDGYYLLSSAYRWSCKGAVE